jgi:hypothetical protein
VTPSLTERLTERLSERAGPMVVKELRQGLRARVFGGVFGALLVVCLLVALVAYGQAVGAVGEALGARFVVTYLLALGLVAFFVIPFSAFRSMLRELEGETWSLLVLTGLDARDILRGKWLTAMSQGVLFGSACAPFVLFSYELNGVDLPQLIVALLVCAVWSGTLTALAIGLATQARTRMASSTSNVSIIGLLLLAMWAGDGVLVWLIDSGHAVTRGPALLGPAATLALGTLVLALEAAAASMSLPTETPRARPRRALVGTIVATLAVTAVMFVRVRGTEEGAAIGSLGLGFYLLLAGVFAISEWDGFPAYAPTGWLARPGAVRSFLLVAFLLVLVAATFLGCLRVGHADHRAARTVIAAAAYPLLYLSLGAIVGRVRLLERFGVTVATRGAFGVITALAIVVPPLYCVFTGQQLNATRPNTLNPFIGLANIVDRRGDEFDGNVLVLVACTVVATAWATVVLVRRDGAWR